MTEEVEITEEIKESEENSEVNKDIIEEQIPEEQINSQNIYAAEEEESTTEETEDVNLADFTQENLSIFKDSFKASKITQDEFDDFMDKIADICGEEKFTEVVIDTFGEDNYINRPPA